MLMMDTEPKSGTLMTPWASTSHSSWARSGSAAWGWGNSLWRSYFRVKSSCFKKAAMRDRLGTLVPAQRRSSSGSVRIVIGPQPGWCSRISHTASRTSEANRPKALVGGLPIRDTRPERPSRWYFRRHLRTVQTERPTAAAIWGSVCPASHRSPISIRSSNVVFRPRLAIPALLVGDLLQARIAVRRIWSTRSARLFETFVKVQPV
jgi:hypothetical protein